ncbi:MAG: recombinase family protein [Candidatus Binataceae bacterium]
MKYGYARVSTDDQTPALQLAALKKAGCKTVFKDDGLSGATTNRPRSSFQTMSVSPCSSFFKQRSRAAWAAACAT